SRAAKAAAKSGAAASRRWTMGLPLLRLVARLVVRPVGGAPGRAQVGHGRLDALYLQADGAAAGEDEGDEAGRLVGRLELDRQQRQHRVGRALTDVAGLDGGDPVEAQAGAP